MQTLMRFKKPNVKILVILVLVLFFTSSTIPALGDNLNGIQHTKLIDQPNPSAELNVQPLVSGYYKESTPTSLNNPQNAIRNYPKDHPMNDYSDVLVVVNDNSAISKQIGTYFCAQRNIPQKNVCNVSVSTAEQIDRTEFENLRNQVETHLDENNLTDKVNFIVTTKGVPIRISHGTWTLRASVDSELSLILGLYSNWIGDTTNTKIQSIYYNQANTFTRKEYSIYLVTRLTGYNFSDVKNLIDNAAASVGVRGSFFFDRDPSKWRSADRPGNNRLSSAHTIVTDKGYTSTLDNSNPFLTGRSNLAGYASWGTFDSYYYSTPVQNSGLNQPNNEAVTIPSGWTYNKNTIFEILSRNITENRSERFSVNITRLQNDNSYASLSQNVTIKANTRYFLSGYAKLMGVENYLDGGVFLQIKAFNSTDDLVWMQNSTRRYGTWSNWGALYQIPYEPIPGVTKLMVSAVFSKAKGIAFVDDIALYEIKPKNTYVPGAIGDTYGYSDAYTNSNPHTFYRVLAADFIMDGITGMKGYVDYATPYLDTNTRVNVLFDRYTEGYTLAESYWMASPYLSWVDVVIGDPKCAPYFDSLPDAEIEVQNITFDKAGYNQGEQIQASAVIKNNGGSELQSLKVTFKYGENLATATEFGTETLSTIPIQSTRVSNFDLDTTGINGTQRIWVHLDSLNEIREQNETNNYQFKEVFINSYPYGLELKVSTNELNRGETVSLFINASDIETPENLLNCSVWFNHSEINAWVPLDAYYNLDHWQSEFSTEKDTNTGRYDIMVNITDEYDVSISQVKKNVFEVKNNPPDVGILDISKSELFRTENLTINYTATDFEETVTTDMQKVLLKPPGTNTEWFEVQGTPVYSSSLDHWQFILITNKTYKLGNYDLRIQIIDSDNDVTIVEMLDVFKVLNNHPVLEQVTLDRLQVYRDPSPAGIVNVYIYGNDIETPPGNAIMELEYRLSLEEVKWTTSSSVQWVQQTSRWEAIFKTDADTYIGNYTFRARLGDADGIWTEWLNSDTELKVMNNPPVATHTFGEDTFEANEDEAILFDAANSTDAEDIEVSEFLWDFGDGNTSPEFKVSHTYINEGSYYVILTVFDKDLGSNSSVIMIHIANIGPTAVTTLDRIQAPVNEPISFDGSGSYDTESDTGKLRYLWDFDDGATSQESKASHTYNESGTYSVTFTVWDDNGDNDSSTLFITIEPLPVKSDDGPKKSWAEELFDLNNPIMFIIIILIIIIAVGIAAWLARRAKPVKPAPGEGPDRVGVEQSIETVDADIVDIPEFATKEGLTKPTTTESAERATMISGTAVTVKPRKAEVGAKDKFDTLTAEPGLATLPPGSGTKLGTLPDESGAESIPPEIEIVYTPEIPGGTTTGTVTKGVGVEKDEVQYPMPVSLDSDVPEIGEDEPFEVPKIDIPQVSGQVPESMVRPEVQEAQQRGEGVSFDFKRPEKKRNK
jgi:uncharacterized protein (TIGR03790 family)